MKDVVIYTDGACSGNPGPGGFAAILICDGIEKEICGGEADTTNNRMELRAPIEALKVLTKPCRVDIFSDSSYVVNCFVQKWIYGWARAGWKRKDGELKNVDLLKELYALCGKHDVTWHKVKGHADNAYNNRCDRLAVEYSNKYKNSVPGDLFSMLEEKSESSMTKKDDSRTAYTGELFEKIETSETVFDGKIFKALRYDVSLPDGSHEKREVVRHNGGSAVIPVDDDGNVYMVRQYRVSVGEILLEIPAGKVEVGEDAIDCANRELEEETGLIAGEIKPLISFYPTPGYCSEKIHVFIATGLKQGAPHRDDREFLHVVKYPLSKLVEMVQNGSITDSKTAIAIMMADRIINSAG
ncbi:MAG: ribonuclease HI [Clostridia bacterium]|nr:ribonuclease HI [Clostridia bacterium]